MCIRDRGHPAADFDYKPKAKKSEASDDAALNGGAAAADAPAAAESKDEL